MLEERRLWDKHVNETAHQNILYLKTRKEYIINTIKSKAGELSLPIADETGYINKVDCLIQSKVREVVERQYQMGSYRQKADYNAAAFYTKRSVRTYGFGMGVNPYIKGMLDHLGKMLESYINWKVLEKTILNIPIQVSPQEMDSLERKILTILEWSDSVPSIRLF